MSDELKEGVELAAVHCPPSGPESDGLSYVVDWRERSPGIVPCESIVICEQSGQMANVPWARIEITDGRRIVMVNLANVESVELA